MRVYSRAELEEQAKLLSQDAFCQRPEEIALAESYRLLPKKPISTLEYALTKRFVRKPDNSKTHWSVKFAPFAPPIMAALDNPDIPEVIVPKPSRCGGTMIIECHALKCLEDGPVGDIGWYLSGPEEVRSYADRVLEPMFEDHKGVAEQIGKRASDNKKTFKRVAGQVFELLVMGKKTTTNRQFRLAVIDEPDTYSKDFRSNWLDQIRQRQRALGTDRKIYACSHADIGWTGGIAQGWVQSNQGIAIMKCAECGGHASPYPTKYWPEVPRFRLHYEKAPEGTPINERLALARMTASMACPHCSFPLSNEQRIEMAEAVQFMHKGQALDIEAGIIGAPDENKTWGFWVHVLISPQVGLGDLASELEAAIEHKERTGKSDKLKQVMIRTFGEVFEGAGDVEGLDAQALKKRTSELTRAEEEQRVTYRMGTVPRGVLFLTLSIDVGGGKFDLLVRGWDQQRRSWLIDRRTIRQRQHRDGLLRDIAPAKVQEDWSVLEAEVDRLYPMQDDPSLALPIAVTTIDASDGNVTWKAYEFARRMDGRRWGVWRKVRCIKGSTNPKAEPLPASSTKISKDSEGKPIEPVVTLHVLGVHKLKEEVLSDLAIEDNAPGQCFFAEDTPDKAFEEMFNEPLIDGSFIRNGPNETLDLYAYTEAGRLMLQPDREGIHWDDPARYPPWAKPVSLLPKGGDPSDEAEAPKSMAAEQPKRTSFFDNFKAMEGDE